jgi:hypothetical protein
MVVRLGSWIPFEPAAKMVTAFSQVRLKGETVRQLTLAAGAVHVQQEEAAVEAMARGQLPSLKSLAEKLVVAVDGAMVPLVGGQWQEVRTMAIGEVEVEKTATGEGDVISHNLSYFSRLMDAQSFQSAALVETERRGLCQARAVALLSDGAEWVQGFADYHRPDALRILDYSHASERFTLIEQRCQEAGVDLATEWAQGRRQQLKEEGGTSVLTTLEALQAAYPQVGLDEPIAYLAKREAMLHYPLFQAQGWPIGSGAVESANKLVVEARLKGAGMHWGPDHVNPMLALRNVVCSDRWEETWPTLAQELRQRRKAAPVEMATEPKQPEPNRVQAYFKQMQLVHHQWQTQQRALEKAEPKKPWKPPADHPWRRDWHKR